MCFFHQITLLFFFSSDFCYIVYYLLVLAKFMIFFLCIRSLMCIVPSLNSVVYPFAWVCLVCSLLCKEEGFSPVSC